jgi:hypothetical protein
MNAQEENDRRVEFAEKYLKEGHCKEAIGVYHELVGDYPEQDSYLLALAWACLNGRQLDSARDCFERLFEKELMRNVFTGFAFDELVRIFREKREYGRLVEICEKAVSRYPGDTGLLGELGHACLAAGDWGGERKRRTAVRLISMWRRRAAASRRGGTGGTGIQVVPGVVSGRAPLPAEPG